MVDGDSGGQRILRSGDPASQRQSPACARPRIGRADRRVFAPFLGCGGLGCGRAPGGLRPALCLPPRGPSAVSLARRPAVPRPALQSFLRSALRLAGTARRCEPRGVSLRLAVPLAGVLRSARLRPPQLPIAGAPRPAGRYVCHGRQPSGGQAIAAPPGPPRAAAERSAEGSGENWNLPHSSLQRRR